MDSTMSLFGSEFSLFGEDLLFPPAVPADEGVVTAPQDGLKTILLSASLALQTDDISQGQSVPSPEQVSGNPLEDWLDTRIDLLDLVAGQDGLSGSQSLMDLGLDIPTEEHTGLQALKMEAEKTSLELSTQTHGQSVEVVQELQSQASDNIYEQGLGLLELLTSEFSQKQALETREFPGLDLGLNVDTSGPILSPMSPEDVETLLSSGPTSPESLVTEESFEFLMSSVMSSDVSFDDTSVMNEVSMIDQNKLPIDLAALSQQVESHDTSSVSMSDSDMENSENVPYQPSREKKRSRSKKETSEEALGKIVDRKLRKKQQNKDAATRYRQKKKAEQGLINSEVYVLETRNKGLKDKVDQMTKEIKYLKALLSDVYRARSKTPKSK